MPESIGEPEDADPAKVCSAVREWLGSGPVIY
jgi:hypothetical protein